MLAEWQDAIKPEDGIHTYLLGPDGVHKQQVGKANKNREEKKGPTL